MVKDLLESFRVNWVSRLSSPLFAALAISWAVWNYRMIFTLLSSQKIHWRFEYVDSVLYPTWQHVVFLQVVLPVVTALLYIYAFPIPAKIVFEHSLRNKVALSNAAKEIEGKRVLSHEEAEELRSQIVQAEARRATEEQDAKQQISVFRGANEKLSTQLLQARREIAQVRVEAISIRPDEARGRVEDFLLSGPFHFIFNSNLPREQGAKNIVFGEGGVITMGATPDANMWAVGKNGEVVITDNNANIYTVLTYNPAKGNFIGHLNGSSIAQALSPAPLV
ncbi:hypothetical protein [uncultured Pseudoxanthomonas sp.]|uniref:hypothetical protein n=1 Tax=uncultured Pseudoxanthomonas sp. TaxID=281701 RepID=UPI0026027889|nr:hypothetical protein [uncultured Pseudoxanthomonas sp.]